MLSPLKIHRKFDLDPSCKLYLPFYAYGSEQTRILDISGQNNHGVITGAVPASYPMLSPVEFVTNGNFTGSATGWILGAAWAYVANAADKNIDGITTLSQTIPIVVGKRYKLSYWVSNWTVGTVTPSIGGVTGTARGANGYHEEIFITSSTADLVFTPTNLARFTIDTISIQEVVGYEGLGWGFDGVDDYVNNGNSSSLDVYIEATYLAWIRPTQLKVGRQMVIARDSVASRGNSFGLQDNFIYFEFAGGGGASISTTKPNINQWNFIAGTATNVSGLNQDFKLYLNGVLDQSQTTFKMSSSTSNTNIGRREYTNVEDYFGGNISDVLIFNRALSAQEIRNYYELTRSKYGV